MEAVSPARNNNRSVRHWPLFRAPITLRANGSCASLDEGMSAFFYFGCLICDVDNQSLIDVALSGSQCWIVDCGFFLLHGIVCWRRRMRLPSRPRWCTRLSPSVVLVCKLHYLFCKRKSKRKRKQKRNEGSNIPRGASRVPRRLPLSRFCFAFVLIYVDKKNNVV